MNKKTYYAYNPETGEYTGTETAFESPREPGVYLNSPNSTETEPPTAGEHQTAIYKDGAWTLVPDYRGSIYYDTATLERHEIKTINIEPDAAWTTVAPPLAAHVKWYGDVWVSSDDADAEWTENAWVVPFSVLKTRKLAAMAAARYAEETAGVTVSGTEIKTDRESQSLITGAALQATQNSDYSTPWKCSNGFVTLTAAQILAIAQAVRAHVEAAFAKEATVDTQIEAATTQTELDAVVWPAS
jgi:hypothetical protein